MPTSPDSVSADPVPQRKRLPDTRQSVTQKNAIGAHEFYVIVGFYDDDPDRVDMPAEIFVHMAKEGSTLAGVCDMLACSISIALQHGVPWEEFASKLSRMRFEPMGASADLKSEYQSLGHAIVDTVERILRYRRSLWGGDNQVQPLEQASRSQSVSLDCASIGVKQA